MEDILLAHEKAELEQDIEATMATVSPNPHYEFPNFGWAADGTGAVREHYRRVLPNTGKYDIAAEKRVHASASNTLIREAWVSFTLEGERYTGMYLVVISFDADLKLISGERLYTDSNFAKVMGEDLGDDYGDVPGVSRIDASAPIIDKHDAFAEAAARGITITAPTAN
ncbi:hypothetical protein ACFWPX_03530 [Nocardia sp. NPDC058518]